MKLKGRPPTREEADRLVREPKLDPFTRGIALRLARGWNELSGERALGFGATGNLPARAIDWWCRKEGADPDLYIPLFVRMDVDRVEREEAKRKLKEK